MAWIGSTDALPYLWPLFLAQLAICSVGAGYAKRKYAEHVPTLKELASARTNLYAGLLMYLIAGLARAHWGLKDLIASDGSGFVGGFLSSFRWGLVLIPFAMVVGVLIAVIFLKIEAVEEDDFGPA